MSDTENTSDGEVEATFKELYYLADNETQARMVTIAIKNAKSLIAQEVNKAAMEKFKYFKWRFILLHPVKAHKWRSAAQNKTNDGGRNGDSSA